MRARPFAASVDCVIQVKEMNVFGNGAGKDNGSSALERPKVLNKDVRQVAAHFHAGTGLLSADPKLTKLQICSVATTMVVRPDCQDPQRTLAVHVARRARSRSTCNSKSAIRHKFYTLGSLFQHLCDSNQS